MAKRKSKAAARLRKLKNRQQRQWPSTTGTLEGQLQALEQGLQQRLYSQCFHHEAMMGLLTSENEPDSDALIGAMVTQRWLQQSGHQLAKQLTTIRLSIQKP